MIHRSTLISKCIGLNSVPKLDILFWYNKLALEKIRGPNFPIFHHKYVSNEAYRLLFKKPYPQHESSTVFHESNSWRKKNISWSISMYYDSRHTHTHINFEVPRKQETKTVTRLAPSGSGNKK